MHPHPAEANEACPPLSAPAAFRAFFQRHGRIVVRQALSAAVCAEAVDGFLKEVHLDTRALFQRHAGYAAHVYSDAGHMRYPIVNLPDIPGRRYPQFKAASMALLTSPLLRRAVETLLGEPARLVRSMYADGIGAGATGAIAGGDPVIGAWIAAEDAGAGHAMAAGDLLLWDARTEPEAPACSRRAYTGYYTGRCTGGGRAGVMLGGMEVLHYSEHRGMAARAAVLLRAQYPLAYSALRRLRLRCWPSGNGAWQ